jgi:hypothetical protein
MEVTKETSGELHFGHQTVGRARKRLSDDKYDILKGVLLRAPGAGDPAANTDPVWVGGAAVTADSGASGGMPLPPGESMFLPLEDIRNLWLISTTDNQDLAWITV